MARIACALLSFAAMTSAMATAAELGTLFHTPEERARLDRLRRGDGPEPAAGAPRESARPSSVTGYVRRSDGRNTVWVDGTPLATRNDPRAFDPRAIPAAPAPKKDAEARNPAPPAPPPPFPGKS